LFEGATMLCLSFYFVLVVQNLITESDLLWAWIIDHMLEHETVASQHHLNNPCMQNPSLQVASQVKAKCEVLQKQNKANQIVIDFQLWPYLAHGKQIKKVSLLDLSICLAYSLMHSILGADI